MGQIRFTHLANPGPAHVRELIKNKTEFLTKNGSAWSRMLRHYLTTNDLLVLVKAFEKLYNEPLIGQAVVTPMPTFDLESTL